MAATVASVASSLAIFLVGAEAVEIRQSLHFGAATFGALVAVYYLGAGSGSVPASRLAERVGGVRVMRAACVAAAVVLALLAAATVSWEVLAGLLAVAGVVGASMQSAVNLFLARRAPAGRQGTAFGVKQASVPAAALVGGLAVPAVALTVGWRWSFVAAAAVAAGAAAVMPRPRTTLAERRSRPPVNAPPGSRRPLVVLATGFALAVVATSGLSAFTATSAVAAGISPSTAGLLVALGGAVAVAVRIISGVLADHRGRAHLPVVAIMLLAGAGGYGLLAAAAGQRSLVLFAVGTVVAYGAGWGWNGVFNFAIVRTHAEAPARATGITQVGGRLAGAAGPLVFGLVATHISYSVAWTICAAAAVGGAATVLAGRDLLRRRLAASSSDPAG